MGVKRAYVFPRTASMPFIDIQALEPGEPRPGWHDRYFRSDHMSFVQYDVDSGSTIHEHSHPEEEVWLVLGGRLEVVVDGQLRVLGAGSAAVVPSDARHSICALEDSRVMVVDHPARGRLTRARAPDPSDQ